MVSDARLVQGVLDGRRGDFVKLAKRHFLAVYGVALAALRDPSGAETVACEAFLSALQSLDTLNDPNTFSSWVFGIVRDRCVARKIEERRNKPRILSALDKFAAQTSGNQMRNLTDSVWSRVAGLDSEAREIIVLYYIGSQDLRQVASCLAVSQRAVTAGFERARAELGPRIEQMLSEAVVSHRPSADAIRRLADEILAVPVSWQVQRSTLGVRAVRSLRQSREFLPLSRLMVLTLTGLFAVTCAAALMLLLHRDRAAEQAGRDSERLGVLALEQRHERRYPNSRPVAHRHSDAAAGPAAVREPSAPNEKGGPVVRVFDMRDPSVAIANAAVVAIYEGRPSQRTVTDHTGRAYLEPIASGKSVLSVIHEQYLPQRGIEAALDNGKEFDVALDPGLTLSGRVVIAESGKPVESFTALVVARDLRRLAPSWKDGSVLISAPDGRFKLAGLANVLRVVFLVPGLAAESVPLNLASGSLDLGVIRLHNPYQLDLLVLDDEGRPVPNAEVSVPLLYSDYASGVGILGRKTDNSGTLALDDLSEFPDTILIDHPDYAPSTTKLTEESSNRRIQAIVTLQKGATIRGRVTRDGKALENAVVILVSDSHRVVRNPRHPIGPEGEYVIEHIVPGEYGLVCVAPGVGRDFAFRQLWRDIEASDATTTKADFDFPSMLGKVTGRVLVGDRPPTWGRVHLWISTKTGRTELQTACDSYGFFTFDEVFPGNAVGAVSATIRLGPDSGSRTYANHATLYTDLLEIDVEAGKSTELNFYVGAGPALRLSVQGLPERHGLRTWIAKAAGGENSSVKAESEPNPQLVLETFLYSNGVHVLPGLGPGTYTMAAYAYRPRVRAPGQASASSPLEYARISQPGFRVNDRDYDNIRIIETFAAHESTDAEITIDASRYQVARE
ncbi:MAG: hypothetical protein AMXMBFR4_08610 [Candidatus Hydrogenedentota bacterium]